FQLVTVSGLQQGHNLFVNSSGSWLSDFVPAEYRLFPFFLSESSEGKSVLCFNADSGLLSSGSNGLPFFVDGSPSDLVKNILRALTEIKIKRQRTQAIVQKLLDTRVLEEWPLTIKNRNESQLIKGLYRINEAALASIDGETLISLR